MIKEETTMKKILAVLLAVLMAFSVLSVGAAAEGDDAQGTVYTYSSAGIPRIKSANDEVTILQAGDIIRFETLKAATKRIEIRYYPDAASIKARDITNKDWKENKVPQYNLDSTQWELKEGQAVEDLLAKSPNYYKSFYNYADFVKGETVEIQVTGLNAETLYARDSANVDRGESPIDFALENATFVGWALFNYSWKNDKSTSTVEVYALWDRGAAPEKPTDVDPDKPVEPTEPQNKIQATYAKVMAFIEEIAGYIAMVPSAFSTVIPNYVDGLIRNWLYGLFGIEA